MIYRKNESEWWWKSEKLTRSEVYRHNQETPAFFWELARRTKKEASSFPGWPQLPKEARRRIINSWHRSRAPLKKSPLFYAPYRIEDPGIAVLEVPFARSDECADEDPYNSFSDRLVVAFDMTASDKSLRDAFISLVKEQRERTKTKPRPKNKGSKPRRNPWGYIEALDYETMQGDTTISSMRARAKNKLTQQLTDSVMRTFSRAFSETKTAEPHGSALGMKRRRSRKPKRLKTP